MFYKIFDHYSFKVSKSRETKKDKGIYTDWRWLQRHGKDHGMDPGMALGIEKGH